MATKGIPLTATHKQKIREALKGNHSSPATEFKKGYDIRRISTQFKKGHPQLNTGRTHLRKGLAPWNKGKQSWVRGDKHPRWKGGFPHCKICGKQLTAYTASYCIQHIGLIRRGANHPNWRGGRSRQGRGFTDKLKESIRQRDGYTCHECGYTQAQLGATLNVHHIDYDTTNNDPSNLISLCRSCHAQTNFTRTQWQEYFTEKLEAQCA